MYKLEKDTIIHFHTVSKGLEPNSGKMNRNWYNRFLTTKKKFIHTIVKLTILRNNTVPFTYTL